MFTGIITEQGTVASVLQDRYGLRLRLTAPLTAKGLTRGGSVAVDGVCLTAVDVGRGGFQVQVVPETMSRSTLGRLGKGRRVNLERPLTGASELGGHFVQGHVDACARVAGLRKGGKEVRLAVQLPHPLKGLVVEKGSIAINGVSLTVASLTSGPGRAVLFTVALIPHTLAETNLAGLRAGDHVNLEADILGKYVAAMLGVRRRG